MSVFDTQYDRPYSPPLHKSHKCSTCGGKLSYPFVCWESGDYVCICGRCCQQIKDGLMADLIQVAATWDMRALRQLSDRNSMTLGRVLINPLSVSAAQSMSASLPKADK